MNKQILAAFALSTALFTGGALADSMSATSTNSMAPASGGMTAAGDMMAAPHKPIHHKPKPMTHAMVPANAMAPASTMAPANTMGGTH